MNTQTGINSVGGNINALREDTAPVFEQRWWLDAVCGEGNWQSQTLLESRGAPPLVWPLVRKTFGPFQYLTLPLFTPKINWVFNPAAQYTDTGFFKQNPLAIYFRLGLTATPENQNLLEKWGFACTQAISYQVFKPDLPEKSWAHIKPTARARIQKAAAALTVECSDRADILYKLAARSHGRHGLGMALSAEVCRRIVHVCTERNQGGVFTATDVTGRVHAAALLVWDQQWMYYLLAGMDEKIEQIGGPRLLIWHTMQLAFAKGLHYDFHGGMSPEVGAVYASMGAAPVPYLRAMRYRPAFLKQVITTAKRIYAPNDRLFH